MMRCGKLKTGSLFSRRLKFWFYGGVSLILADFGISMAHAQGRDSHGVAMQQQDGALVPDLDNFDHLLRTSYRTAIAMLLGLRRDADAAKLADEMLEHYPRASGLHFQIAAMFRHFHRCSSAKRFFRKMQQLYRSSPQWPRLRQIEKACGDLWIQDAIMQLQLSREKSLLDAPQQDLVPIAEGSQIDQFCQLRPDLCGDVRHVRHNVFAPSGYLAQMTTTFMMSRPDYHGNLQHFTLQLAKNMTSQPAFGSDGLALRQWREKTFSYQHGLSIERHWADQMTGQLFRLQGGIAGQMRNEIEWQMGYSLEWRNRLFHGWRRSSSFGNQIKFDLRWPLSPQWVTILSYQQERRYFLTRQLYPATPHTVLTNRLNMRVETKIDRLDGVVFGAELGRYVVRSQYQSARRRKATYALYARYQF